jgi:citrate synthase
MALNWRICRALGVMTGAMGIVGHLRQESRQPMAQQLWLETKERATLRLKTTRGHQ